MFSLHKIILDLYYFTVLICCCFFKIVFSYVKETKIPSTLLMSDRIQWLNCIIYKIKIYPNLKSGYN